MSQRGNKHTTESLPLWIHKNRFPIKIFLSWWLILCRTYTQHVGILKTCICHFCVLLKYSHKNIFFYFFKKKHLFVCPFTMLLVGWYFAVTFCYASYYSVFVLHLISAPKFSATSSGRDALFCIWVHSFILKMLFIWYQGIRGKVAT